MTYKFYILWHWRDFGFLNTIRCLIFKLSSIYFFLFSNFGITFNKTLLSTELLVWGKLITFEWYKIQNHTKIRNTITSMTCVLHNTIYIQKGNTVTLLSLRLLWWVKISKFSSSRETNSVNLISLWTSPLSILLHYTCILSYTMIVLYCKLYFILSKD
jgi:hypothetical protein